MVKKNSKSARKEMKKGTWYLYTIILALLMGLVSGTIYMAVGSNIWWIGRAPFDANFAAWLVAATITREGLLWLMVKDKVVAWKETLVVLAILTVTLGVISGWIYVLYPAAVYSLNDRAYYDARASLWVVAASIVPVAIEDFVNYWKTMGRRDQ